MKSLFMKIPVSTPNPATADSRRWKSIPTVLLLGWLASVVGQAADLRVGVAATDITPPLGIPMAGYYHARGADGVLDPLFSKAMVVESDGERAALVTLDLISVTRAITDQARAEIEKATGIKGGHVMISATHAHTGPELAGRGKRGSDHGRTDTNSRWTTPRPCRRRSPKACASPTNGSNPRNSAWPAAAAKT